MDTVEVEEICRRATLKQTNKPLEVVMFLCNVECMCGRFTECTDEGHFWPTHCHSRWSQTTHTISY